MLAADGGGARTIDAPRGRVDHQGIPETREVTSMDEMRGSRMVSFGAIMVMLAGAFNVLDGIVAVAKAGYFGGDVLFSDVKTWGWFFIGYGTLQFLAGLGAYSGSRVAQWVAIAFAAVNALAMLAYVQHSPAWSFVIIALDLVVIYALATHGKVLSQDMARGGSWERPAPSGAEIRAAGPRAA
jgi:hypothetical protein